MVNWTMIKGLGVESIIRRSQVLRKRSYSVSLSLFASVPDKILDNKWGLPRLYVGSEPTDGFTELQPSTLFQEAKIPLSPDQIHYLTTVLRLKRKPQAYLRVFDVTGEWLGVTNGQKPSTVQCLQRLRAPEPRRPLSLAIAPPHRKERLRFLVEKCTELGVSEFRFLATEYSQPVDLRKVSSYIVSAVEQCERLDVPSWNMSSLDKLQGKLLACRERSPTSKPILEALQGDDPVTILVGPEGGWSEKETQWLNDHCINVSLGSLVLRSETAAMTAVAAACLLLD